MVHLDANRDHRLRPFDFRTSHHPISAFSAQEKYGATGAFSSNRIHSNRTHVAVRIAGSGRKKTKAERQ
jgi:hypothetical protein